METGVLLPSGEKIPKYGCQLISETPGFGDGFELLVDIFCITLLSNAHCADDDHVILRIDTIDRAVVCELVFPITGQRAAQRQSISFRVNGQLFL